MGINDLHSVDSYWNRDQRLRYAHIADHISRWRYCEISRYLHFMNNDNLVQRGDPAYDRLGKVRPLINHLTTKFKTLYEPSKEVAVDEAVIKFQGRLCLKQYMPMKPIKHEIEVWVLGDSANRYFSRLDVYCGKGEELVVFDNFFYKVSAPLCHTARGHIRMWNYQKGSQGVSTCIEGSTSREKVHTPIYNNTYNIIALLHVYTKIKQYYLYA